MGLTTTVYPTVDPIHLDAAKLHLRVDDTADDALIRGLISAARATAEEQLRRRLVARTLAFTLDTWPGGDILLPGPPAIQINSITYTDLASAAQTLSSALYDLIKTSDPARVIAGYNDVWPTNRGHADDVTVNYVAGYAAAFTANATTNVLTWVARTPVAGEAVELSVSGGNDKALPAPLAEHTVYYVRDVSGQTCKLAATVAGDAIDLTDTGTGQSFVGAVPDPILSGMLLLIGHLYENREQVAPGTLNEVPFAIQALWGPYRMMEFF